MEEIVNATPVLPMKSRELNKKLKKKLKKLEDEYETAGPLRKERILRQAESIQKETKGE